MSSILATDPMMWPTRVLRMGWVVPGPLDQLTGGYLYDRQMVCRLRERGHRVTVIQIPIRISYLDPLASVALCRAIVRTRWDALVVDELAHPAMRFGLSLARVLPGVRQPPVIGLVHHLRMSEAWGYQRLLARLAETMALSATGAVVCTSQTTARVVSPLLAPGNPIAVIPPGVRGPVGTADPIQVPEPGAACRFICVAHLTPRKGILELLHAFAQTDPGATLDLVGDDQRDAQYAARVRAVLADPRLRSRVTLHGPLPDHDLDRLLRRADACVLPSSYEGYGMALADALALGLPVIATRVGAVPEVVRDGMEAELVPFGDITALAGAMDRLNTDPGERARRASHARERSAHLPTWEQSGAAFVRFVEQQAGGPA